MKLFARSAWQSMRLRKQKASSLSWNHLEAGSDACLCVRVCGFACVLLPLPPCTTEPGPIAKSNVVLDVKPWDDETDMKALEQAVRSIEMDGLVWGACEFCSLFPSFLVSPARASVM